MSEHMYSDLLLGDQLQDKLKVGISKISGMVKRTLGPGGQPIIIQRKGKDPYGNALSPLVTKDGVTVAESIKDIEDPHENNVLQVIKQVARKTNEQAGDGTTTSVVLAEAIFNQALKRITTGYEPQTLLNELKEAAELVLTEIEKRATPIESAEERISVASISANNNREIGTIINEAIEAVGEDGVITLEEGSSLETRLRIAEGFRINRGLLAQHHFVTHPDSGSCILTNASIIVYNGEISRYTQILPAIEAITLGGSNTNKPFFIIANDIIGEALNWLIINRQRLGLNCACIKGPHTTTVRTQMLQDICTMVGATLFGEGLKSLENFVHEVDQDGQVVNSDFGFASRIEAGRFYTTIFGGNGDEEEILTRVEDLKKLRSTAISPYDLDLINQRIACLSNGVAVIECGGATDVEVKEKKDRIEDALNATRAAMEKGIVPGGGVALLRARKVLKELDTVGAAVLFEALDEPIRRIIQNIGKKPEVIIDRLETEAVEYTWGYNARTNQFTDLIKDGVIDPAKVVQAALTNSISIAGLLTTCGGSIIHSDD